MTKHSILWAASAAVFALSSLPLQADVPAPQSDAAITANVSARLMHDEKMRSKGPIIVSTRDGEVTLSGKVATVPMIYRAVELTREVPGVRHVDDENLTTYSY